MMRSREYVVVALVALVAGAVGGVVGTALLGSDGDADRLPPVARALPRSGPQHTGPLRTAAPDVEAGPAPAAMMLGAPEAAPAPAPMAMRSAAPMARSMAAPPPPPPLTTTAIRLVDKEGKLRAEIGPGEVEGLTIRDPDGTVRVELGLVEGEPELRLYDRYGQPRVEARITTDQEPQVRVLDAYGEATWQTP